MGTVAYGKERQCLKARPGSPCARSDSWTNECGAFGAPDPTPTQSFRTRRSVLVLGGPLLWVCSLSHALAVAMAIHPAPLPTRKTKLSGVVSVCVSGLQISQSYFQSQSNYQRLTSSISAVRRDSIRIGLVTINTPYITFNCYRSQRSWVMWLITGSAATWNWVKK